MLRCCSLLLLSGICFLFLACNSPVESPSLPGPTHVVFTYMDDPATTLTANWQFVTDTAPQDHTALVHYDTVSRQGNPAKYASRAVGTCFQIQDLAGRFVYRVSLANLKPATTYYLVVGNPEIGMSQELKVRTMPDATDGRPLRFVTGGDMGTSKDTQTLLRHAAGFNPDFAVIGGDIAYANGNLHEVGDWDTWLQYYTEEMVTPDGFSIPVVLAIGNHEVAGAYGQTMEQAPFFFSFFGQDTAKSYFTRRFGKHFVLFALDSGHVATHESQVPWLDQQLTAHSEVKYQAAVYHVPLYPSHRSFMGRYSAAGRQHWAPLFDKHQLTVAFENHDHTYKRTHLLKADKIAPTQDGSTGTLYLGDGCWGRDARTIDYHKRWYLNQSGSVQHFWVVDITAEQMSYQAVDIENRVFDTYPEASTAVVQTFEDKNHTFIIPAGSVHVTGYPATEVWTGGPVMITIRNSFEFEVAGKMELWFPKDLITSTVSEQHSFTLKPGAEMQLPITFSPIGSQGTQPDQVRLGFNLTLTRTDAAAEKPEIFTGKFRIPVDKLQP